MRVCILTTSFPLYEGIAVGIHVVEQARHLVKLGVEVNVVAPHHQGAKRYEEIDGVQVRRFRYMWPERFQTLCYGAGIPTNLKKSWWAKCQLPLLLIFFLVAGYFQSRKGDLIQANWSIAGLVGIIIAKLQRKPVIMMMYGAEVFVLGDNPVLKFIIRNVDHVVAISQYTLSETLKVAEPKAYSLIPPGVDTNRFTPQTDLGDLPDKLEVLGIDLSKPLIFALGKFIERKGFEYLIEAMALLNERTYAQLMIGGRGPLKSKYEQQIEELNIEDRVRFLDYIPDWELPRYYTIADIFISPSIEDSRGDTEGLGMVLLEAMACETVCVASEVGGILDIVHNNKNGLSVQPKNSKDLYESLLLLINNWDLRNQLALYGKEFVMMHYSWQVKAEEIVQLYSKLVTTDKNA